MTGPEPTSPPGSGLLQRGHPTEDRSRSVHRRRSRLARLVVVTSLLLLPIATACDSGSSASSATTTGPAESVVPAQFEALPRYPDSRDVGSMSRSGATTTQSFEVTGPTPEQILDYYRDQLTGWTNTEPAHPLGTSSQAAWRGRWEQSGADLVVSSSPAGGLGSGTVQYSLALTSS